jgi:hypothetical protein
MTPPEFSSADVELRDALSALMPAGLELPTERIHTRVAQLRRRSAVRMTAAVAAGAVAVAIVFSVLPSGAARGRVRVAAATTVPHRRGGSAPTTAPVVLTTTTTQGSRPFVPALTPTVPNSVPFETSSTTMVPVVAPPNTTAPATPSRQPNQPSTPTTVAPTPTAAPVTVTLILDNAGLHAPTTQVAAGVVTIIFRDQRTDKSNGFGSTLVPEVHVTPADASYAPSVIGRAWWDQDMYGHFNAAVGYTQLSGAVSFQVWNTANHASAGPLVWTTFTAS